MAEPVEDKRQESSTSMALNKPCGRVLLGETVTHRLARLWQSPEVCSTLDKRLEKRGIEGRMFQPCTFDRLDRTFPRFVI